MDQKLRRRVPGMLLGTAVAAAAADAVAPARGQATGQCLCFLYTNLFFNRQVPLSKLWLASAAAGAPAAPAGKLVRHVFVLHRSPRAA